MGNLALAPEPEEPELNEDEAEELFERLQKALETKRKIQRRRQRESLAEFFKAAWAAMKPGTLLEWGPHIQAVCDHVQWQLEDRARVRADKTRRTPLKVQNLVINVPPRSLKTSILTYATVWAWIHWPDMRIMYLSANPRVAFNSAREARDLIVSHWFQEMHEPDWEVRTDQNALTDLGNTKGGARIGRGLQGAVTGEGADWQIVDDPHDLRDSIDNIEKLIEGYDSAVANRINDPRSAIRTCIMQRVNVADLTGHILKKGWRHLCIPMEYESKRFCTCQDCVAGTSPYGWKDTRTEEGEVLHSRFTQDFLAGEKLRLGPFGYASQHQQRPSVAGGGRIKKDYWGFFRLSGIHAGDHPRPPGCNEGELSRMVNKIPAGWNRDKWDLDWIVISVDAANKKTDRGSLYGLLTVGGKDMRRYVLDDRSQRGEFTDILTIIRSMIARWRPDKLMVEAKAAGPSLMSSLEGEMKDGRLRACDKCQLGVLVDLNKTEEFWRGSCIECGEIIDGLPGYPAPNVHENCPKKLEGGYIRDKIKVPTHWMGTCPDCQIVTPGIALVTEIDPIEVDMDKERRVDGILPQLAARLVYLLEGAPWLGEFVEEHALFPESPWNDRVDALSQVLEKYRDGPFYIL